MRQALLAALLVGAGILTQPAGAQDLALGEQLARKYCMRCHRIGAEQQNTTLGPSFHVASADSLELTTKSMMERLNGRHFIQPAHRFTEAEARALGDFIAAQR